MDHYEIKDSVPEIMEQYGGQAIRSLDAKIAQKNREIDDIRELDDRLVDRMDLKAEEMSRLVKMYDVLYRAQRGVPLGMAASGIYTAEIANIPIPGGFVNEIVRWYEAEDQTLDMLSGRIRDLYEELYPDTRAYLDRRVAINISRDEITKLRAIKQRLQSIADPFA